MKISDFLVVKMFMKILSIIVKKLIKILEEVKQKVRQKVKQKVKQKFIVKQKVKICIRFLKKFMKTRLWPIILALGAVKPYFLSRCYTSIHNSMLLLFLVVLSVQLFCKS